MIKKQGILGGILTLLRVGKLAMRKMKPFSNLFKIFYFPVKPRNPQLIEASSQNGDLKRMVDMATTR